MDIRKIIQEEVRKVFLNEGSWGTMPKDSDGALDYKSMYIDDVVNKSLKDMFSKDKDESDYNYSKVGVVQMALQQGIHVDYDTVVKAVEHLNSVLEDEKWLSGWKDKKEAEKSVKLIRDEMQKLIDKNTSKEGKGSSILAPRGWLARPFELEKGSSWSGLSDMYGDEKNREPLNEDVFTSVKDDTSVYWGDKVKFTKEDYEKLPEKLKSKFEPEEEYRITGFGGPDEKGYYIIEIEKGDSFIPVMVSEEFENLITAVTTGGM